MADMRLTVKWVEGKRHLVADALSRAPYFSPKESLSERISIRCIKSSDPSLKFLLEASKDPSYASVVKALEEGKTLSNLPPTHPAKEYRSIWNDLSIYDDEESTGKLIIYDSRRIVVPAPGRS
ncbi:Hypothetical predicted protein, partial [Paramuricea clavata]